MRAVSLVVPGHPLLHVARQPDVIPRRAYLRLEHVDESLRRHPPRGGKFMASRNAPDFELGALAGRRSRSSCGGRSRMGSQIVGGPPSPLRGFGATAFARLAEPKLGEAERRLVDLTGIEPVTS